MLFDPSVAVAGLLFADQSFLSSLGSSRRCALIVHSGDSATYVLPVIRGSEAPESLMYAMQMSRVGGRAVTKTLAEMLREQGRLVTDAAGRLLKENDEATMCLVEDIKERMCYVALDYQADLQSCYQSSALEMAYDLAGNGTLLLGSERFRCSEQLFSRDLADGQPVVQDMIKAAISMCAPALRDELWGSIVLSGGTTLMPGYVDRLKRELASVDPSRTPNIIESPERRELPWIGGSIYANLEFVRQRYVTKEVHQQQKYENQLGSELLENDEQFGFDANLLSPNLLSMHELMVSPYATDLTHISAPGAPNQERAGRISTKSKIQELRGRGRCYRVYDDDVVVYFIYF